MKVCAAQLIAQAGQQSSSTAQVYPSQQTAKAKREKKDPQVVIAVASTSYSHCWLFVVALQGWDQFPHWKWWCLMIPYTYLEAWSGLLLTLWGFLGKGRAGSQAGLKWLEWRERKSAGFWVVSWLGLLPWLWLAWFVLACQHHGKRCQAFLIISPLCGEKEEKEKRSGA